MTVHSPVSYDMSSEDEAWAIIWFSRPGLSPVNSCRVKKTIVPQLTLHDMSSDDETWTIIRFSRPGTNQKALVESSDDFALSLNIRHVEWGWNLNHHLSQSTGYNPQKILDESNKDTNTFTRILRYVGWRWKLNHHLVQPTRSFPWWLKIWSKLHIRTTCRLLYSGLLLHPYDIWRELPPKKNIYLSQTT